VNRAPYYDPAADAPPDEAALRAELAGILAFLTDEGALDPDHARELRARADRLCRLLEVPNV
jgi:hypothetical protein